jgi:hypothetical protein
MPKFSDLKPRDCFRFVNGSKWKNPETRSLIMLKKMTAPLRTSVVQALCFAMPDGWASCESHFYNGCADEEVELLHHFTVHPVPTSIYRD